MVFRGKSGLGQGSALAVLAVLSVPGTALAQATTPPAAVPAPRPTASSAPQDAAAVPAPAATPVPVPVPAPPPVPSETAPLAIDEPVMAWSVDAASKLASVIEKVGADGLIPADYQPEKLRAAILAGPGAALDQQASRSFAWLAEDMRDGRTRMQSRLQWYLVDKDVDTNSITGLMTRALETGDVEGVIMGLAPTHPDYAALKALYASTPKASKTARNLIQVNLDRWRWLPREMGKYYLLTNLPEYQLRLTVDNTIIRSYRTVVGKPGRTATPNLAEQVEAVVFNPTWTVPQSIVVGEGLGARLINNPKQAAREGYKVTKLKDGMIVVVQQPGDNNALGRMKIDMPNAHAIYLHDTPSKALFNTPVRAYSHGCVRTERAVELGMTMAILGAGLTPQQAVEHNLSGKYTKVPMTKTFPVYLTYFTMATGIDGKMGKFADIYGRDAPVLASFAKPREAWNGQRITSEKVIKLDNPI
ncbi:L,D-transpeptidase-like protein [Novosphingobium kunmingense]|uniref:L,D-transpeptidase-like protein n=1 Tax=Novosphingobium kunmingense TaxID=1211806 RepID=A0A2N0HJM0_9SPHN|nr:L,D-transpeptidase family protein [Novosphingobium kunmingense]PKB19136.1 L,D-transpeptidase-like protein [Novosphingobium kunmingense]